MQCVRIVSVILFYLVCYSDARCPNGFSRQGKRCYYFSRGEQTWIGAHTACKTLGGYLVEINGWAENQYVKKRLNGRNHWIGLTDMADEGIWVWSHTNTRARWTLWKRGEPNNYWNQHCVQIRADGQWDDLRCDHKRRYVCEANA